MVKDIIEIVVGLLLMLTTIIGALKYWKFTKTTEQYSSEVSDFREELKKAISQNATMIRECRVSHEGCQRDVMNHLRDASVHRDITLEEFRHAVLEKGIADLKADFSKSIEATEKRLCDQLNSLGEIFKTGNGKTI
jgi:hypothetical protein